MDSGSTMDYYPDIHVSPALLPLRKGSSWIDTLGRMIPDLESNYCDTHALQAIEMLPDIEASVKSPLP